MARILFLLSPETVTEPVWLPLHIESRLGKLPSAVCTASREQISLAWWAASRSALFQWLSHVTALPVCVCVCPKAPVVPLPLTLCLNSVCKSSYRCVTDMYANSSSAQVCAFNVRVSLHLCVCYCMHACVTPAGNHTLTSSAPAAFATYLLCSQLGCRVIHHHGLRSAITSNY